MHEKAQQKAKDRKGRMQAAAKTKAEVAAAAKRPRVEEGEGEPQPQPPHPPKRARVAKEGGVLRKPKLVADPDKPPAARMTKFRLLPNPLQRALLRKAVGITTWTYNQALHAIQAGGVKAVLKDVRAHVLNSDAPLLVDKPWVKEVPYDLRDEAAKDLLQAMKANETKKSKGDRHAFGATFRFQNKWRKSRKLVIHAKHWWAAGVFHPAFFGKTPFRCNEKLPERPAYDMTLTVNWLGQVHLFVPSPLGKVECDPAPRPVVAIDPGALVFGTCYDPQDDRYIEWGVDSMQRISRLQKHMGDLWARIYPDRGKEGGGGREGVGHHARWRMKRAWRRMSKRCEDLITDFHYRFAKWLCLNYRVILLPHYDTPKMVVKGPKRRIGRKTVRSMQTWSFCRFRDRLIGMSRRYPDCHVRPLSEAFTTQSCRCCGNLHRTLGGSRVYECPACKARYPRDDGGSSNVFLRHATMLHLDGVV